MWENLLTDIFALYLSDFLELKPDQLRFGLLSGEISFRNVSIKSDAFIRLGFPLVVRASELSLLQVQFLFFKEDMNSSQERIFFFYSLFFYTK